MLITKYSFGQINFEKGYFIDNDNRKTECLIKNEDWNDNPTTFFYKIDGSDVPQQTTISAVKEFCIDGQSKYIRSNTKIDRSSNEIDKLTDNMDPIWLQEQLFLKVLVEGNAELYSYVDGNLRRFFYSLSDTSVQQLICKRYLANLNISANNNARNSAYNNKFRQQLWANMKLPDAKLSSIKVINYTQGDLVKYFTAYNRSSGDTIVAPINKPKRDFFNIKIAPGLDVSSLSISNRLINSATANFNQNLSLRLGVEFEFILPYNKNKWGILFEPTYQSFKSDKEFGTQTVTVSYGSLNFPVGLRYYTFLNEKFKIFFDVYYIPSFSSGSAGSITVDNQNPDDISQSSSYAFGGGAEYKGISFEIRYYTSRSLSNDFLFWSSDYKRVSFILGYKIFKATKK